MIDFRYHLVSLIAVFLAVALGIVIGTTALNGQLTDNLQSQVSGLQQDKRQLEDQSQGLQAQLDHVGGFDDAVAPALITGTLADRTVVLVLAGTKVPTAEVDALTGMLGTAGATVTSTVTLTDSYSDPAAASSVQGYVTGPGLPADVVRPVSTDSGSLVAGVLAQVLMLPAAGSPDRTVASTAATTVLTALSGLGVVSVDSPPTKAAQLAVVVGDGALPADNTDARTRALLALVTALSERGAGTVVAGDSTAGAKGLVAAVRSTPSTASAVSTVDNLETSAGRISTVLALADEATGGTPDKYGTGTGTRPAPPITR